MFWFFGLKAHVILASRLGIEPVPHALEGKILTTAQPGKSLWYLFKLCNYNKTDFDIPAWEQT